MGAHVSSSCTIQEDRHLLFHCFATTRFFSPKCQPRPASARHVLLSRDPGCVSRSGARLSWHSSRTWGELPSLGLTSVSLRLAEWNLRLERVRGPQHVTQQYRGGNRVVYAIKYRIKPSNQMTDESTRVSTLEVAYEMRHSDGDQSEVTNSITMRNWDT